MYYSVVLVEQTRIPTLTLSLNPTRNLTSGEAGKVYCLSRLLSVVEVLGRRGRVRARRVAVTGHDWS